MVLVEEETIFSIKARSSDFIIHNVFTLISSWFEALSTKQRKKIKVFVCDASISDPLEKEDEEPADVVHPVVDCRDRTMLGRMYAHSQETSSLMILMLKFNRRFLGFLLFCWLPILFCYFGVEGEGSMSCKGIFWTSPGS